MTEFESSRFTELESEDNIVNIHPLKKGKRTLVFLADFFMHLMLSFFFFTVAVAPLGKLWTGYNEKNQQHIDATEKMYNLYYESGVLLKNSSFEPYDVTAGIEYSYRCFLSYLVLDTEESIDPSVPQYGHKDENNMIRHFYRDIRGEMSNYISLYKQYSASDDYFLCDTAEGSEPYLRPEVKNEIYAFFDPKDEMGDVGKTYYNNIQNNVFNPLMAEVMNDISVRDLKVEGKPKTFLEYQSIVKEMEKYHDDLMTVCAFISHFLGWIVYFIVIPFIHRDRKTLAMIWMHIECVHFNTLNHLKRPHHALRSIYSLFTDLIAIIFVPAMLVPFNNLFALSWLVYSAIIALVIVLASLIFMLFNEYNRSMSDYLSNTLMLTEAEMDELYKARGYQI